jgi:hypothetical protein
MLQLTLQLLLGLQSLFDMAKRLFEMINQALHTMHDSDMEQSSHLEQLLK